MRFEDRTSLMREASLHGRVQSESQSKGPTVKSGPLAIKRLAELEN
jgi:hypothetical protein